MTKFPISDFQEFKSKALVWANSFSTFCFLDNNQHSENSFHDFECLLGIDSQLSLIASSESFEQLKSFRNDNQEWLFGYLTYDLKNQLEDLSSDKLDILDLPEVYFFKPRYLIRFNENEVEIDRPYLEAVHLLDMIKETIIPEVKTDKISFKARVPKNKYIESVNKIKDHIIEGDIYELNYCQELYAENVDMDPVSVFLKLNDQSKAPFSACLKHNDQYALCMSPERFLKKEKYKIISQPIKGTIRKGKDEKENRELMDQLKNDVKERAENVMIVDLVRNDLNRTSKTGTVSVEELFGVYTFKKVNHMISTIISEMKDGIDFIDVIRYAFPMGSMTGAPKIRAMELIEKYETTKRGLYSGCIGYIDPKDNFDFNVVIRTLIYDKRKKYASYHVGGAITYLSDPEKEYEECFVKASLLNDLA